MVGSSLQKKAQRHGIVGTKVAVKQLIHEHSTGIFRYSKIIAGVNFAGFC
jgi:hypothetical protein